MEHEASQFHIIIIKVVGQILDFGQILGEIKKFLEVKTRQQGRRMLTKFISEGKLFLFDKLVRLM